MIGMIVAAILAVSSPTGASFIDSSQEMVERGKSRSFRLSKSIAEGSIDKREGRSDEAAADRLPDEFVKAAPKCRGCAENPDDRNLLVFMSFSVPLESWQEYSAQMTKSGGTFVLRGIPDNSFMAFAEKINELRENGVHAPIDIDPALFDNYTVEAVPAIVVRDGERSDKVTGNFQLKPFLQDSATSGDAKTISTDKLRKLK